MSPRSRKPWGEHPPPDPHVWNTLAYRGLAQADGVAVIEWDAPVEYCFHSPSGPIVHGGMVAALLVILWLSVHSARTVVAMLLTTFIGLVITAAIGLFVIGRFNLISVAFIPLFVGLGVDFNIQYSVRSRAERLTHPKLAGALIAAGGGVGPALALSAAAISVGFFSFLPTTYIGVAELGAIAGLGLLINERAGIVNLGAEGMMLVAAVAGFATAVHTGSDWLAFAAGAVAGGLLAAVAPEAVPAVLSLFREGGFAHAAVVGECIAGPAQVTVR